MGLGDILGSISPAYGLISGQGLGSYLKYLSPAYDIFALANGGHSSQPSPVDVAGQQPLAQMSGVPSMAAESASLPGMSQGQSPFSMIGNALAQSNKGGNQQIQVSPAYSAPLAPTDNSLLAQLLGSIAQRRMY